jgi:hypothetical protein
MKLILVVILLIQAYFSSGATTSLNIVTQNLFWWNLFNQQGGGNFFNVFSQYKPFDIMLFQECDDIKRIVDGLGLSPRFQYYKGSHAVNIAWDGSRFQNLGQGFEYVGEDKPGLWGKRGVTWVKLLDRSTSRNVLALSHHGPLPTNTGGIYGGKDVATKLLKVIADQSQPTDVVILGGDFNADAGSETLRTIKAAGFQLIGSDWVDHVLIRAAGATDILNNEKKTTIIWGTGSDHQGVKVRFEVSSGGTPGPTPTRTCDDVWNSYAGGHTCGDRIKWLQANRGKTLSEAKDQVAEEFPEICGPCASSTAAPTPLTKAPTKTPTKAPTKYPTEQPTTPSKETCEDVKDNAATDSSGTFSCGDRISWLQSARGLSENLAKTQVAREFPNECGPCYTCEGPYGTKYPECEARIKWMLENWDKTDAWKQQKYRDNGVDGTRCSIQTYLATVETWCP